MTELVKRTLSGAVYVGCVVGSILWNPIAFGGLFFVLCLLAVDEFHRLVKSPLTLRICALVATIMLWIMVQCFAWREELIGDYHALALAMGMSYLPIIVFGLLDEIWNHSERPMQNWGNLLISQFMIAAPMATLCLLYSLDKWLLLALFVLIWVNDTGAYCVGSLTAKRPNGNHKMTPHISPKKSWEGLIGGVLFTIGTSYILYACGWLDSIAANSIGGLITLCFAVIVSAFGTMGDLMESLFKRSIGVKDSGHFMPGHGGVLDRFDSILLAGPILTSFCWLCYFIAPLL